MDIDLVTEDRLLKEFLVAGGEMFEGHFPFKDPVRNGDSFTLTTPIGPVTMIPLAIDPKALPQANLGVFSDALCVQILRKRPANPGEGGPVSLFVYTRDTSYSLHDAGLALVRRRLHDLNVMFDHVIFFWPRVGGPGEIEILHPFPRELMVRDSVIPELRKMSLDPGTTPCQER